MTAMDNIARILILFLVVDWTAVTILTAGALRIRESAIIERAIAAWVLSIAATLVAILGLNRLLGLGFDSAIVFGFLITAMFAISIPQALWLVWYARGGFE